MNGKQLRESRAQVVFGMRDLVSQANEHGRSLTDEERAKFDKMDADVLSFDQRIKDVEHIETLAEVNDEQRERAEQREFHNRKTVVSDSRGKITGEDVAEGLREWLLAPAGLLDQDQVGHCRRIGFDPAVKIQRLEMRRKTTNGHRGTQPRDRTEARNRLDWAVENRAQSVGTATAGGHMVPDEMMASIDVALLQFGGMRQVAEIIQTDTGADLPFPETNDTSNTGEIPGENTTVTEQDVTFSQMVLNSFKYSSKMVRVSYELLQDSNTNVPQLLGRLLGERIGRIQNTHFTTGAGTTVPWGIVTRAVDSSVVTASNTAVTYSELLQLKHSVDIAYRSNATWMGHDTMLRFMKEMSDSQGRPIWLPSLEAGEPDLFDGHAFQVNNDVDAPATTTESLLFGDLSKYKIRDVTGEGVTLIRLDERYAELGQVAFLAWMRSDGDLLNAAAGPVKHLTMAT